MIMNRKWAALALGLVILLTGGHSVAQGAELKAETNVLNRSRVIQVESKRALESTDLNGKTY